MYKQYVHSLLNFVFKAFVRRVTGLFLLLFFFINISVSFSQTTIWLEDFPYADGTTVGSGTPPKWTRDVSNCTLVPPNDYFEVKSGQMEGRDLDGEAVWTSEAIDISGYTNVSITTDVSCSTPNLEASDYIRFYYILDGGSETLFSVNGDNSNDFDPLVASQSGLNGNSLVIVVRLKNNGGQEKHRFDNMRVFEPVVVNGDVCSDAIPINEVTDLSFNTNSPITASGVNPSCGGGTSPYDIWYAYTPSGTGMATFDLCGSNFDTRLAIWDGCGGTQLACNDDNGPSCTGLNASIQMEVTDGVTYYVQVGGYSSNRGTGDLTIMLAPYPVNDDCNNAIPIGEVDALPFSTSNAHASGIIPSCGGSTAPVDIWYAYTATQTGSAVFSLCGSDFSTRIAVWDACGGTELGCNDSAYYCSYRIDNSELTLNVVNGTTYYVQVAGTNAVTGDGSLTISVSTLSTNDLCNNALPVNSDTTISYTTVGATTSGDRASCVNSTDADPIDIWFVYTAPVTGVVNIGLCDSYYDSQIAIWDACGGNDLDCNDDDGPGCPNKGASVQLGVTSGTDYYIQVFGWDGATGNGDLTIQAVSQPTNDDCANATAINEVTDTAYTTQVNATAGGDNPGCGGATDPVDIWYAYTPSGNGMAHFDLCTSSTNTFDTRLAIWDGCSGNVLDCNDNSDYCSTGSNKSYIAMQVSTGNTYYVQVGGYNGSTGTGDLTISLTPTPTNDDCSNAIAINEVTDLPFTTSFGVTAGGDNPACGGSTDPVDIWYAYTATATGRALFDLCGSNFDTRIALWDACGGNVLACDDDDGPGCSGTNASLEYNVTAGNTYYVQVGGYNATTGDGDLSISFVSIPNGQWIGVVDSDWNTPGNWVNGVIPTALIDTRIINTPPNFPKVDEVANCKNLLVNAADSITINTSANLTANGDFTNNGVLTVNDGIFTITGNLNTSNTAKVDVNGGTLSMNGWFNNGAATYAKGAVELTGGTINVATDMLLDSTNTNGKMDGPFNMNVTGSLEMDSSSFSTITGGTVTMKGAGHVYPTSVSGSFSAYNLAFDGSGNYYLSRNTGNNSFSIINNMNVQAGNISLSSSGGTGKPDDFSVGNDITISNGATLSMDVTNNILLNGNFINNGTFSHNSGTFVFNGSTTVSGASTTTFGDALINNGKSLTGPVSGLMNISGDFTNNGTFNHNGGTLGFLGSTQTIGGTSPIEFNNLTINTGSTTTINTNGETLLGILKVDGTLNANGNITLISTSSQTALVDGAGTGIINGSIAMQRYLPSGFGYHYVGSPVAAATVGQFSPIVDLAASFPPVFRYDEDRTYSGGDVGGWIEHSDPADDLIPMHGYAVNFGASNPAVTFTLSGVPNNGNISAISLYNHNHTYTQGFNLMGNPYPSPIDWDAASGWTKTNIDDAIYYFNPSSTDQYGGTYSSYVNGVSSDGVANNFISSMQGFFVHVTDGSYPVTGSFGTNNSVRVNNLSPAYHKKSFANGENTLLRLCAGFKNSFDNCDPLVIYFNDSSETRFLKKIDALKIMNSDEDVPSMYAFSSDRRKLSIYSVPFAHDSVNIIPLGVRIKKDGPISFSVMDMELFPDDMNIYLHDSVMSYYHDLKANPEYTVSLSEGDIANRFSLVFARKDIRYKPSKEEVYYAYSFRDNIYIYNNAPKEVKTDVKVYNMTGQRVWSGVLYHKGYNEFKLHVQSGFYILRINSVYDTYSRKLVLINP